MANKKFFLLSPLLWIRKMIVMLLVLFVVLGILVYFLANSPWVIKKAANIFAPDYNITYSRIHGNVLTGVEIEDLAYDAQPLAKHVGLKWNPNGLLKKQILVNHVALNNVNVDTIQNLVDAFSSDDNTSSDGFSFSVSVAKVDVDIDPFVEQNISIKNIILHAKDIYYNSDTIGVGNVGLVVDTNITKLLLQASLKDGTVAVKKLKIKDLDTLALESMLGTETNSTTETEKNTTIASKNPLIPQRVTIENLEADVLPRLFDPVKIKSASLKVSHAAIDLNTLVAKKGDIFLSAQTNFAKLTHEGKISDNHLLSMVKVFPKKALFTTYNLPLREKSFDEIIIKLDATQKRIIANIDTQVMQVLKGKKDTFNLDINKLKSTVTYTLHNSILKAESTASVSTPYAKDIALTNLFVLDKNISYSGDVHVKQMIGVDTKFVKPLNDLNIKYMGDDKSVNSKILSKMLQGSFVSDDFKSASLHIESKKSLLLRNYVELPPELNATKADVKIDLPLDFDTNASYIATLHVKSNVANIDANVSYRDNVQLTAMIDVPEKSLLRPYSEALQWDKLMPVYAEATLFESTVEANLHAGPLSAKALYELNTSAIKGKIQSGGLDATIAGDVEKKIHIDSKISDIPQLMKSVSDVYTLDNLPKVDGSANLSVEINALKKIDLSVKSPLVSYHTDHKSVTDIRDIDLLLHYEDGNVSLKHYSVTYDKEKIFSTKPSEISFDDKSIILSPLWVNDQLKAEGSYNLKTKKGKVTAEAKSLHISHEMIDLDAKVDSVTLRDGNKTNVQGKIVLLDGDIHYDISQKSFVTDSDIIIVQDMKKEQNSTFMDNLSVDLQMKTKKPLVYNKDAIRIKANVDVGIHKVEYGDLLLLGSVEILKGGTYIFQNKKFTLDKSNVYFTGNPTKPLLDIKVHYKTINYLVTIAITGTPDLPNIAFSSKPRLSKEQILSLILFDTEGGAGTNSGDEMMKMMGGAVAKSALNNMGVKIDHLVLGEGNSIEVGKKLTNKIMIIYVNDVISEVKLKYEHSPHTESVIGASEKSQSYDIIYKKDF